MNKLIDPCPNRRFDEVYYDALEWINSFYYSDYVDFKIEEENNNDKNTE